MATRWACLGPGRIASDFFKSIRANLPEGEHEFVAVASSTSLENAQAFGNQYNFSRAYGSHDEVTSDESVEIVYISTINRDHFSLTLKMLRAGKHVLCETPMAYNETQVQEVFQVARENNRFFSEGHVMWTMTLPTIDMVRRELARKSVGDIRFVRANLTYPLDIDEPVAISRELGGGASVGIGVYCVSFATLVFNGDAREDSRCWQYDAYWYTRVDEKAAVILQYKNGALANLTYGFRTDLANCNAIVLGSAGNIEVHSPFYAAPKVTTPSGELVLPNKDHENNYLNVHSMYFEADVVRNCIKKGEIENPHLSKNHTLLTYRIMDEIRRQLGMKYPGED